MDSPTTCPKCGSLMEEHDLTAADGTPLGYSDGAGSGALMSLVCPECGYAELRAQDAEPPEVGNADEFVVEVLAPFGAAGAASGEPAGYSYRTAGAKDGRDPRLRRLMDSYGTSAPGLVPKKPGPLALIGGAVCAAFMFAEIVWLWFASGPVMMAGGYVARGGPYVIAHQAEDWIWLPTIGATVMMFALVGNLLISASLNRPNLILPFWAAIFGLLSVPFLRFGFNAPGGGLAWGWIVCGVVFVVLAVPAVLLMLVPESWRGFSGSWAWANILGAVGGIAGAIWVWGLVA